MDDQDRISQMEAYAESLVKLPDTLGPAERTHLTAVAHAMKKFAKIVLDRDAGPTDTVKVENTALEGRLENALAEKASLVKALADLKAEMALALKIANKVNG